MLFQLLQLWHARDQFSTQFSTGHNTLPPNWAAKPHEQDRRLKYAGCHSNVLVTSFALLLTALLVEYWGFMEIMFTAREGITGPITMLDRSAEHKVFYVTKS